jgi:hypothetical protein
MSAAYADQALFLDRTVVVPAQGGPDSDFARECQLRRHDGPTLHAHAGTLPSPSTVPSQRVRDRDAGGYHAHFYQRDFVDLPRLDRGPRSKADAMRQMGISYPRHHGAQTRKDLVNPNPARTVPMTLADGTVAEVDASFFLAMQPHGGDAVETAPRPPSEQRAQFNRSTRAEGRTRFTRDDMRPNLPAF